MPCEKAMEQFADFVDGYPLVAHNASFDTRFLDSEFQFIGRMRSNPIACSMLASRRIYPDAPNHKLGTLVGYCDIETDGTFHRALADAEMTGHLWISMIKNIKKSYGLQKVPFELMQKISTISKAKVSAFLEKEGRNS